MAADKQRRAFISYSRMNKEFATKLTRGLRSAGYPVWFDLFDIPTGVRWDDEVEKALRECSIFMVILTPASIASENVKDEIGYAIDHGKRILPVLLEECDVPLRLRRFQYVDFTTKSFEEGFESAKELLGDLVDEASTPVMMRSPAVEEQLEKKVETERKAKEEADRLAKQKADPEATAKAERKAKAKPAPAMPVEILGESVSAATTQKKPVFKELVIGIVVVVVLVVAGIGFSTLSKKGGNDNPSVDNPATEAPVVANPATEVPAQPASSSEKIQIHWFVGLGDGTDEGSVTIEQSVVDDFNNSQDKIELTLEVVPNDKAKDTLATEFASGNGPDIIGPAGFYNTSTFPGQWLDLSPYINETGFDTSIFEPALVNYFQTDEGQVSLPFMVFPTAIYYVPKMFDEAGLNYPPANYGDQYVLDGNTVDWNWDILSEVAKRLTLDANGLNSTQSGFDRNQIVQIGFDFQWLYSVNYLGSLRSGAATIVQNNQSVIPSSWKEAHRWYFNGMWGDQPFIPTATLVSALEFGNGNLFSSGKEAMTMVPIWYTCCLSDFVSAGNEFQVGILPLGDDGQVHGNVEDDSFFIWKDTQHPKEAFEVLSYLITTGGDNLIPQYAGMSAIASKNQTFFDGQSQTYPFVKPESWNVFQAGVAYPDIPSSYQYQPNFVEAIAREQTFSDLLKNNSPSQIDFDYEWQLLIDDLNAIYNR